MCCRLLHEPKKQQAIGVIYKSVLDMIGKTPMVELSLNRNPRAKLFAKLEKFNPGGSVKDRIALSMIGDAEQKGILKPGSVIVEPTSGNTGIGLALVGRRKGYRVKIVMPADASSERKVMIRALGGELVLTPASKGVDGARERAAELAANPNHVMLDQYSNDANWLAHYSTTANEIWGDTGGKVTHFVAGMGTGGTLMGVSRRLKELNPSIKIIGVEPTKHHHLAGLKNMRSQERPAIYDESLIDEVITVTDEQASHMARALAEKEGLLVGMSSGAAAYAALALTRHLDGGVVVALFADGGERYLSTRLFDSKGFKRVGA